MRIKQFVAYALLLLIAAGAQPAYSAFWQWSKTAATNATADPTINWAEGMSPSSVNDSARAQMAREAEQRDDQSGLLASGGTSTAYTLATNQGMCLSPSVTPQDGQTVAFTANNTNGTAPTLAVDSCTVYPIQSSAGVAIGAGSMVAGTPYTLKFSLANGSWITRDFYVSPFSVPLGGILYSTISSAPNSNFVAAAGQCISQSTYATYYAAIGSPGVGSCGAGNFNVPVDARGRTLAGLDNLGGSAANRLTNAAGGCGTTFQTMGGTCANASQSTTLITANLPPYTPSGSITIGTFNAMTTVNLEAIASNTSSGNPSYGVQTLYGPSGFFTGSAQGGTSAAFSNVPPIAGVYVYIRVL